MSTWDGIKNLEYKRGSESVLVVFDVLLFNPELIPVWKFFMKQIEIYRGQLWSVMDGHLTHQMKEHSL